MGDVILISDIVQVACKGWGIAYFAYSLHPHAKDLPVTEVSCWEEYPIGDYVNVSVDPC